MNIFEKRSEEIKEKNQVNQRKISLNEEATRELEDAFLELKKESVKITRSQLASEAVLSYCIRFFNKDKETIKNKYFDPQAFLKGKLKGLKTRQDLENALKDSLKKKRVKKVEKETVC